MLLANFRWAYAGVWLCAALSFSGRRGSPRGWTLDALRARVLDWRWCSDAFHRVAQCAFCRRSRYDFCFVGGLTSTSAWRALFFFLGCG